MSTFLLVDGHAYAYRAFFAIRNMTGPDLSPTNAIYGFISMLDRMRDQLKPAFLAVIWDGGLDAGRTEQLPAYKAQRPSMPDDLSRQIDSIREYLRAAGITEVMHSGVEADDIIASLAAGAVVEGESVVIASPDKDFYQIVSDQVRILNAGDKTGGLWGAAEVEAKTGVKPAQIVDWLSLVGDSVDNIEGVVGVGPKTAARLLHEYGFLDDIYRALEQVKPEKLREALRVAEPIVRRNQSIVRLKSDIVSRKAAAEFVVRDGDATRLGELFRKWGFRSQLAALERQQRKQVELFPE